MIRFDRTRAEDAEALTEVQTRAFDDDSRRFLGLPEGGPEGYNSVDWQLDAMRDGIYYKVLDGERIIGGVVLWDRGNGHMHLGVLFIEPEYQDRGIGSQVLEFVEARHADARKWTLDTPALSTRNHHFYEKFGYVKVGEAWIEPEGLRLWQYEKIIT